jgi:hypothetical protein
VPAIFQYEGGIAFIPAVHDRLQYHFAGWTNCLSRSFDRVLTSAPGNRLFQTITGDIPSDLTALVHYVIDRLLVDADRELMRLVYSNPFCPYNDSNTQTVSFVPTDKIATSLLL